MFGQEFSLNNSAVIKVMGVGGGGCNAVNSMVESNVSSAEFISVNTDNQALLLSKAQKVLQIGAKLTKGLGAGSDPSVGEAAAEESKDEIAQLLEGTDLLFIAAGMGGGTGTGAASVIARIAREMGILTVAVVTKPFSFEGRVRNTNANKGIANLKKHVDTLVVIPNDKLLQYLPAQTGMLDAFKVADDMLKQGIVGIVDLIATPSLINLDFADVNTVMRNQGLAHMGIGRAKGENRVIEAVRQAVSSPLLETTIEGARSVIINVTGGKDLMLNEVSEAAELVQGIIDDSANIIFGATIDESMVDEVKITVIATGFAALGEGEAQKEEKPAVSLKPEKKAESFVPPLIREIEATEKRLQDQAEAQAAVESAPDLNKIEEELEAEPERKGIELPAFMKKLFKR
ncbi:MAG: cell division protein FtsZ [Clostridiales bacterium]|nr:cell division protein FtsZ [Clostridiales bacterium]